MRKILIFLILIPSTALAVSYKLGKQTVDLPFEKALMAKTSSPEENLVFFDPNVPSPRPIFNAALSVFTYPKDLSSFETEYRREKERWLQKEKSELIGQINIENQAQNKAVITSFRFKHSLGEFEEWARFEECPSGQGISLKWMIPVNSFTTEPEQTSRWKEAWKKKICPAL